VCLHSLVAPPVDLTLTKTCPCLAARRRARAITRHFDAFLRPHGLRSTQFSVMAALALRGPTVRGRLADGLGLERTTLTRSAATLERQGWIETRETNDGRERPLALTVAGRRALDAALPAWKEALDRLDDEARPPSPVAATPIPGGVP
jgi:DNA-binding MarR family transcriptional regulator